MFSGHFVYYVYRCIILSLLVNKGKRMNRDGLSSVMLYFLFAHSRKPNVNGSRSSPAGNALVYKRYTYSICYSAK